jgi:c(7)-type cytochrome triheme protein
MRRRSRRSVVAVVVACLIPVMMAWAEYADVILNNNSENEGVAPVIFPHWFHRIRFQCSVCHVELGIKMRAGSTDIRMEQLVNGRYCGACHDGDVAWPIDNCDLCHSGKPGLETGVKGGHKTTGPGVY